MNFVSTRKEQIQSVKCCVLFNPKDGSIQHVHRVVTLVGAEETPDAVIERRTLQLAREMGLQATEAQLLHVDEKTIQTDRHYVVDVQKRVLVALRPPLIK